MHIVVLIKQVPLTSDVAVDPITGIIQRESGETKMNPYDLYAIEVALRLKGTYGGTVSVLTMGPRQAEAVIREAYAMGVDTGYLLSDRAFAGSDVLATSYALSQGIRTMGTFDLILSGKQTTDGDTAQVGPECSEFLAIPCLSGVQHIHSVEPDSMTVTSDTGTTWVTAQVKLPALLSIDSEQFQPRLPSYVRKKDTKHKTITTLTLADLPDTDASHYGLEGSPTQVQRIFPPEHEREFEMWCDGNLPKRLFSYLKDHKYLQERA
jgi:electron transfer flavoprotein beta subunit